MTTARHLVALRGDESNLYGQHAEALRRVVARRVHVSHDLVEEACQQAWLKLLRRQPDRGPTLFGWLVTVAVREGYRLSARSARDMSLDVRVVRGGDGEVLVDRFAAPEVLDDAVEARRALRALAGLRERQRRYVGLVIAGWSYAEIAEREGVTHSAVNRHLTKGRRRLRAAREHAA